MSLRDSFNRIKEKVQSFLDGIKDSVTSETQYNIEKSYLFMSVAISNGHRE